MNEIRLLRAADPRIFTVIVPFLFFPPPAFIPLRYFLIASCVEVFVSRSSLLFGKLAT
jgi:uncharacterized membrane protein